MQLFSKVVLLTAMLVPASVVAPRATDMCFTDNVPCSASSPID
jgi:hypothetical protein